MTPYIAGGRAHRLPDVRLFDVSNIDLDGMVFPLGNVRREWNKVMRLAGHTFIPPLLINPGKWTIPRGLELQPPAGRVLAAAGARAPSSRHGRGDRVCRCANGV